MIYSDNIYFNISERISEEICSKSVSKRDKQVYQSETQIYANHWLEVVHEIGHWMAAIPKYRKSFNLGLDLKAGDNDSRMLYEEAVALKLTFVIGSLLLGYSFKGIDLYNEKSPSYMECSKECPMVMKYLLYMSKRSDEFCKAFKIPHQYVQNKVDRLTKEFTTQIKLLIESCYIIEDDR